jgi:hypothetical protein
MVIVVFSLLQAKLYTHTKEMKNIKKPQKMRLKDLKKDIKEKLGDTKHKTDLVKEEFEDKMSGVKEVSGR